MREQQYKPHPLAECWPLHEGPALWEMSDHIKEHGQQNPIMLFEDQILDGRRRNLACLRAGVEPKFKAFKGDWSEALAYVEGANQHRRHLGDGEKALVAARLATLKKGKPSASVNSSTKLLSQSDAAKTAGTSVASLKKGKEVLANGTPELVAAVEDGTVSVTDAAAVASEPAKVQNAAVKKVRKGKAKTAKAAVASETDIGESLLDNEGHEVPKNLNDAFHSLDKFAELDSHCKAIQKGLDEISRLPGGEQIRFFLTPTGTEDKKINKSEYLNSLKRDLKGTRPHSVCPWCQGKANKECKGCKGNGWVTKVTWDQAEDAIKEKLK